MPAIRNAAAAHGFTDYLRDAREHPVQVLLGSRHVRSLTDVVTID